MPSKRHRRSKRNWLNPKTHDDTGALSSGYDINTKHADWIDCDISIQVRDCGRQIELAFAVYGSLKTERKRKATLRQIAQRRKKIDIIRDHLDLLDEGLDIIEDIAVSYEITE